MRTMVNKLLETFAVLRPDLRVPEATVNREQV